MIQGLSTSSPPYTVLPMILQDMVERRVLRVAPRLPAPLLDAYRGCTEEQDATVSTMEHHDTCRVAWKLEKMVVHGHRVGWCTSTKQAVAEVIRMAGTAPRRLV